MKEGAGRMVFDLWVQTKRVSLLFGSVINFVETSIIEANIIGVEKNAKLFTKDQARTWLREKQSERWKSIENAFISEIKDVLQKH